MITNAFGQFDNTPPNAIGPVRWNYLQRCSDCTSHCRGIYGNNEQGGLGT